MYDLRNVEAAVLTQRLGKICLKVVLMLMLSVKELARFPLMLSYTVLFWLRGSISSESYGHGVRLGQILKASLSRMDKS